MTKILKPYTIIPANLYVSRDADRQIESIIEDMGRPGYVLVSRQMGKTNLLINAKRKLESAEDVFVYIDLSNPFDTSKACFENIINSALEINQERFKGIYEEIASRRRELIDTPPHKQHTNELRLLLKQIPGKLVVILDEIDALTKTHYSDQVFAQIRSVYFSRVNFPELERLTYILSGVVEPTDIIKDPKISPFNIGQKIFLNDFSKREFLNFLDIASLSLSEALQERVYYWTHGNPRITWDVCSEIENKLLSNESLSIEDIDKIVIDQYLTAFDKPPIDNIRGLVKDDHEIRNAIIEIKNNKSGQIPDKIKNKLYLAGITNYNENNIEIKNEIINQSISLSWIKSLVEEERGYVKLAVDSYSSENYIGALAYFEKYLQDNEFDDSQNRPHYYYMLGFSSYKTTQFEKAIDYLNLTNFDINDEPKSYYDVILLKALCCTYLEKYDEAHYNYKLIIDSGRKDETYIKSLINYGSVSIKAKKEELLDEALEIFVAISDAPNLDDLKIKKSQIPEVRSVAYYNTGVIYSTKGDDEIAEKYFAKAMEVALPDSQPLMGLALVNIVVKTEEKYRLLADIVNKINNNDIDPKAFDPEYPLRFSVNELEEVILECFLHFRQTLFIELSNKVKFFYGQSLGAIMLSLAINEINKRNWDRVYKIFDSLDKELENDIYEFDNDQKYEALKLSCCFSQSDENIGQLIRFADLFVSINIQKPDAIAVENFAILIAHLTSLTRYTEALKLIATISRFKHLDEDLLINYLIIDHLELNVYNRLSDKHNAIDKANQIIALLKTPNLNTQQSNIVGESGLDLIKKNAEMTLSRLVPRTPSISSRKFARNDIVKVRYKDGIIIETKFKRIESDIKQGLCIMLN